MAPSERMRPSAVGKAHVRHGVLTAGSWLTASWKVMDERLSVESTEIHFHVEPRRLPLAVPLL